jgi:CubicO group peptidase (beta-lactamase class C family)
MPHDSTAQAARERADGLMTGFPPAPEAQVTLANWQDPPYSRWAFRHMRELIPSHPIPAAGPAGGLGGVVPPGASRAGPAGPTPLPAASGPLPDPPVWRLDGSTATAAEVFADTYTDALVVLHDGQLVAERYAAGMTAATPHLLMSVSKSLVGCVAGVLAERGRLDPAAPVTTYVPEAGSSGYAGATVRHLLDMRTGVAFRETYTELDAEVRVMERSMGWRPAQPGDPAGAYPYLITLGQAGPHGGEFTYRSADSDMLGWVCERASGTRMADLISALIWQPMGAERDGEITCDPLGSAIHDGGVSVTARDLARFGQLLADDGYARGGSGGLGGDQGFVPPEGSRAGGYPVIPAAWLAATRDPGPGVREAFAATDNELVLPGGWYRNQFWVLPGPGGPVLVCLGIHGQLVYADRATRTVVVKMSSWPDAQHTAYLLDTLRACAALAAHLSATG